MRKFFRFVLMSLVLVAVGVMSALTAMRVTIHGRETTVPNFVKLTPEQAERLAESNGLRVTVEGHFYSADIPEGNIVSQQPPPGTRVRRGWPVRLARSLGAQRVPIPDVQGESERAAELNIRQRGLEMDTVALAHIPDAPTDEVIAQSPPPKAVGVVSPKVSVLMALPADPPTYVMPDFVGRSLAEASAMIDQAGFKSAHVETSDASGATAQVGASAATAAAATVVRQIPAAGQRIPADATITLVVNR